MLFVPYTGSYVENSNSHRSSFPDSRSHHRRQNLELLCLSRESVSRLKKHMARHETRTLEPLGAAQDRRRGIMEPGGGFVWFRSTKQLSMSGIH